MHLGLTLVTSGLWIPLWILFGALAVQSDRRERSRHVEQTAAYNEAYRDWQWRCRREYGYIPHA